MTRKFICCSLFVCALIFTNSLKVSAEQYYFLLIDSSETMKNRDPDEYRLDAATLFVDMLNDGDQITVVSFAENSRVVVEDKTIESKNTKHGVCKKIRNIHHIHMDETKSNIIGAIKSIKSKLITLRTNNPGLEIHVLLLTCGGRNVESYIDLVKNDLDTFFENKTPIHTIALGDNEDADLLRAIAHKTRGSYYSANKGCQLLESCFKFVISNKNLASTKRSSFDVWDKTRELTVVLFKNDPKDYINLVEHNDTPIKLNSTKVYRSKKMWRRPKPRFYDFVRIKHPEPGKWSVSVCSKDKRNSQIHAIQPFPYKLNISKPEKSKYLENEKVDFDCQLAPKSETPKENQSKHIKDLLNNYKVILNVNYPSYKHTKHPMDIYEDNRKNPRKRLTFTEHGYYSYNVVGKFETGQSETKIWETNKNGIFYVGPKDFKIKIAKLGDNLPLEDLFEKLEIVANINANDLKSSMDGIPQDAEFEAVIVGSPLITVGNISDWDALLIEMQGDSNNFKTKLLTSKLNKDNQLEKIKTIDVNQLTNEVKEDIVAAFNAIKDNLTFYRDEVAGNGIKLSPEVQKELNDLKGILDESGELKKEKTDLSNSQKEDIKWFNIAILKELFPKVLIKSRNVFYKQLRIRESTEIGELIVDNEDGLKLHPGNYTIKVTGSSGKASFQEAQQSFEVKGWPEPDISSLDVKITIADDNKIRIGEDVYFHAGLINKMNVEKIKLEDVIDDRWQIMDLIFKDFEWRVKKEDKEKIPVTSGGLSKGDPIKHKFNLTPNSYKPITIKGKAELDLEIKINEQAVTRKSCDLEFTYLQMLFPHIEEASQESYESIVFDNSPTNGGETTSNIDWPDINNFEISHNLPESLPLESNILILVLENEISRLNDNSLDYYIMLNFKQDGSPVVNKSLINNRFRVESIKWGIPKSVTDTRNPVFKKYKLDNLGNTFLVGSFFEEGNSKFQLSVDELMLSINDGNTLENKRTKTYHNIQLLVDIKVSNPN